MKKTALIALLALISWSEIQAQQFKVLLFTKTDGWHHESIQEGVAAIKQLAARHDFGLLWTENSGRDFKDEVLSNFDVVIFLNTTMNVLNDEEQKAFERFIQSGKGYVGIHAASDTEYDWPWYNQLVGRMFHVHPRNQTALLKIQDRNFPGMQRFPDEWWFTDEWYIFGEEKADNLKYLLTVDESSYDPGADWGEKKSEGMGDFHPISWYHTHDGGRAFYTALGHIPGTFSEELFREHIYGGIFWAATGRGVR